MDDFTMLDLVKRYSDWRRKYHNLGHVAHMFEKANDCNLKLSDAQTYAILFHDVIYDPARSDNEEKSAEYAHLNLDVDYKTKEDVCEIIRNTQKEIPTIPQSCDVIDLDLCDLCDEKAFSANTQKIYNEYLAFYPETTYEKCLTGRAKWLSSFLQRPRIYVGFLQNKDDVARQIMSHEFEEVKAEMKQRGIVNG